MSILKVARMGHPVLRAPNRLIEPSELEQTWFKQLIVNMKETMNDYGGIGLAAPQVHESLQVAIIDVASEGEDESGVEVFINPKITPLTKETSAFWEGCLSVPGLRGLVSRPNRVKVEYMTVKGEAKSIQAEGFVATVIQHELDHLAGILYVDRIDDMKNFAFEKEYEEYSLDDEEEE